MQLKAPCEIRYGARADRNNLLLAIKLDTEIMDSVDTEMMDYYDHDERERKQIHHSSGSVRIYRAGPDESDKSGGSSGGGGGSGGGGDGGFGFGDFDDNADTNKLDYNYN